MKNSRLYRLGLALQHFARFREKMLAHEKRLTSLDTLGGNTDFHPFVCFQNPFRAVSRFRRQIDNMSADAAWYPTATAETLPQVMLETDPRMSCQHLEGYLPAFHRRQRQPMPRLLIQQHVGLQACLQEKRDEIDVHGWRHDHTTRR